MTFFFEEEEWNESVANDNTYNNKDMYYIDNTNETSMASIFDTNFNQAAKYIF